MQVEFQHIIYLGHVFSIRCWNISIQDGWNRREGGWGVSNIVYHLDFRLLYMSSNRAAVAAYQKDDSKVSTRTATEELRSLQRRVSQLTSLVDQLQAEVICILFIRIFVYKHITLLINNEINSVDTFPSAISNIFHFRNYIYQLSNFYFEILNIY